jgi:hypothetical protein
VGQGADEDHCLPMSPVRIPGVLRNMNWKLRRELGPPMAARRRVEWTITVTASGRVRGPRRVETTRKCLLQLGREPQSFLLTNCHFCLGRPLNRIKERSCTAAIA